MLASDQKNTVLSEMSGGVANTIGYTAYGHQNAQRPVETQLGFNGEFSEPDTGWQLLGNGYRAYSQRLMRFQSPDSWSPFGDGGLNAYAYCEGEPVSNVDRDGHSIWGNLLRVFRPTTKTVSTDIPVDLVFTSKKGAASVLEIKPKDVTRLNKTRKLLEHKILKARRANEAVEGINKNIDEFNRLGEALPYADSNTGTPGITRESREYFKVGARDFDKIQSKFYKQKIANQMHGAKNSGIRGKVQKSYLGDGYN